MRLLKSFSDRCREIGRRGKLFTILEDRRQLGLQRPDGRAPAAQAAREAIGFKRALKPGSGAPVAMIVADECRVTHQPIVISLGERGFPEGLPPQR